MTFNALKSFEKGHQGMQLINQANIQKKLFGA